MHLLPDLRRKFIEHRQRAFQGFSIGAVGLSRCLSIAQDRVRLAPPGVRFRNGPSCLTKPTEGIERLAMLRYGIKDLRVFLDCDPRFLEQF